ncbi:hypothetical protein MTYP_00616 [Methylophilaceae bacterium]|nr:hypothetical protein MTYP_00616 [Methylophilaceae bacterium]
MATVLKLPDWTKWLRIARAGNAPAMLSRRHIYILPTRYGWFFAFVLLIMLVGAINYTLSLGFVLVFLLAGMGNMAMLHAWRNLAYLNVSAGRIDPVFAGDDATFEINIADTRHRARYAVAAHFEQGNPVHVDIPASGQATAKLTLKSRKRGWLPSGRIKLHTEFPLALFHVWAYVDLDCRCLVYPRPTVHHLPIPNSPDEDAAGSLADVSGDDDFFGHRAYQLGDSPRRIDWKASSREQGMFTKQFQGTAESALWLDWSTTPGQDSEQRIRQLTRWVLDADADNRPYGLRLPGLELAPDTGKAHYHQCLQALALM